MKIDTFIIILSLGVFAGQVGVAQSDAPYNPKPGWRNSEVETK